jgi:hypothetical protein
MRRAHAREVLGAVVGVVGDHQRAGPQAAFHQRQHLGVERLGAVEQQQVDGVGQVGGERLQRVALADFHQVVQAAGLQVGACARHLGRLELGGDQVAAAVVAQRRGEKQRGDAERGAELDDAAPPLRASM